MTQYHFSPEATPHDSPGDRAGKSDTEAHAIVLRLPPRELAALRRLAAQGRTTAEAVLRAGLDLLRDRYPDRDDTDPD